MRSRFNTRNAVILGASIAFGAAFVSLGFVPSVRRYLRMKSM